MSIERIVRMVAGAFVTIGAALAYFHSIYWLAFVAFVGLNLFQSAFTGWCPLITILKLAGVKSAEAASKDGCCN